MSASGWICYAEKTHGNVLLPHISTARSPQQVMGSLVKDFFSQQQVTGTSYKMSQDCSGQDPHAVLPAVPVLSPPPQPLLLGPGSCTTAVFSTQHLTPEKIYHVTVMPCYDKKLEASRPDFFSQEHQTRDVDCVITTGAGPRACWCCVPSIRPSTVPLAHVGHPVCEWSSLAEATKCLKEK